jgi:hypothetical protein
MHSGVPQIMLGILLLVGGVLVVKLVPSEFGWLLFLAGAFIGCRGGISISASGQKEIGN